MSPVFAQVLASGRAEFNRRFLEARRPYPDLTPERFGAVLTDLADPLVQAVETACPGSAASVGPVVYDATLVLAGQRLVGPGARHSWVTQVWTQLLPALADKVATDPERLITSLTHAVCHLAVAPAARPQEWISVMAALGPQTESTDALLALGQVVAWRAGLAHFRAGALVAADRLPSPLAVAALQAPVSSSWSALRPKLAADPWYAPARRADSGRLRVVGRVGAFRGFGGLFVQPPTVTATGGQLVAHVGPEAWLLVADVFGATFHRVDASEGGAIASRRAGDLPSGLTLTGSLVTRGTERLDFSDLGRLTSFAIADGGQTLALTGDGTHAVVLVALS